jgi:hypothetical protein
LLGRLHSVYFLFGFLIAGGFEAKLIVNVAEGDFVSFHIIFVIEVPDVALRVWILVLLKFFLFSFQMNLVICFVIIIIFDSQ